jgi:hypothetical protein
MTPRQAVKQLKRLWRSQEAERTKAIRDRARDALDALIGLPFEERWPLIVRDARQLYPSCRWPEEAHGPFVSRREIKQYRLRPLFDKLRLGLLDTYAQRERLNSRLRRMQRDDATPPELRGWLTVLVGNPYLLPEKMPVLLGIQLMAVEMGVD